MVITYDFMYSKLKYTHIRNVHNILMTEKSVVNQHIHHDLVYVKSECILYKEKLKKFVSQIVNVYLPIVELMVILASLVA